VEKEKESSPAFIGLGEWDFSTVSRNNRQRPTDDQRWRKMGRDKREERNLLLNKSESRGELFYKNEKGRRTT